MSCFLCSKEHFIKTRDLSYNLIISENTYFCYWDSVNISATNSSILEYVNKNIIDFLRN